MQSHSVPRSADGRLDAECLPREVLAATNAPEASAGRSLPKFLVISVHMPQYGSSATDGLNNRFSFYLAVPPHLSAPPQPLFESVRLVQHLMSLHQSPALVSHGPTGALCHPQQLSFFASSLTAPQVAIQQVSSWIASR